MNDLNQWKQAFVEQYGGEEKDIRVFHAPGRVNLIGEHTDYNGGYVFPGALTFGTTMLIRPRADNNIYFSSANKPEQALVQLDDLRYEPEQGWINYPKGVLYHLQQRGYSFGGYDVWYHGAIPLSSGLSSSASIEVVSGFGFLTMEGVRVGEDGFTLVDLALVAQEAENQFIGVNCGIMDQFSISLGKADHAIKLKCDTLDYEHVPFDAGDYRIVIGNTCKSRGLVDSEYNTRRSQCEQAVSDLRQVYPQLRDLGELSMAQFAEHQGVITSETVRKRAEHVIAENDRVLQSVQTLSAGDLQAFGQLMIASHESLRDLYEVSCRELDIMVEQALLIEGVLGSRMTGAGFGGCTVSLVHADSVARFIDEVGRHYEQQTGVKPEFYVASLGDGVKEV